MAPSIIYYAGLVIVSLAGMQLLLYIWESVHIGRAKSTLQRHKLDLLKQKIQQLQELEPKPLTSTQAWSGWRKFRVKKIEAENASIKSFYLAPHDEKPLPDYLPGQHLTFKLKVPGISKPVVRCYSLSDSGFISDYYRVSIKNVTAPTGNDNVPDGVSSGYFHNELEQADILDVQAPAGKFYLDVTEKTPVVLVAGGIGITPSLSMLNALCVDKSNRKICLFYGVRNTQELILKSHFDKMESENSNVQIIYVFSDPSKEEVENKQFHYQGRITVDLMKQHGAAMDADFYICGPKPMMNSIVEGLHAHEVDKGRIHFESFGPASVTKATKISQQMPQISSESLSVEFTVSNKVIAWTQEQGTLLEMAEANGVPLDYGCRAGSCGTCLTAIIDGEVDYVDECGMDVEKGSFLACIAIPKSNIRINA